MREQCVVHNMTAMVSPVNRKIQFHFFLSVFMCLYVPMCVQICARVLMHVEGRGHCYVSLSITLCLVFL